MPALTQITLWIIGIGIAFIALMICRMFVLWYFGVLKIHAQQQEIIVLLNEIAGHHIDTNPPQSPKPPTVVRAEPPKPKPSPYDLNRR